MDIRNTPPYLLGLQDKLLLQKTATELQSQNKPSPAKRANPYQDVVKLSKNSESGSDQNPNGSKLKSDILEETLNGFRRTQEFEKPDGKIFTRIEEKVIEDGRSKTLVILQNKSGATSIFENIIDQQSDGSFRQIKRFTDNNGETQTDIQLNVTPDKDIIFGQNTKPEATQSTGTDTNRGSSVNFTA